jgi:hypothetical protein
MWYSCRVSLKLTPPNNFVILEPMLSIYHKHQIKYCGLNSDQVIFLTSHHPSFYKQQHSVNRISFWNAVSTKTRTAYNIKNINQKDNYWPLSQTFRLSLQPGVNTENVNCSTSNYSDIYNLDLFLP